MTHIDDLRKGIDAIDDQLVELLEKRMEIVLQVAEYKKHNSVNVKDRSREEKIVNRIMAQVKNEDFKDSMAELMDAIFRSSRKMQRNITAESSTAALDAGGQTVGYQGVAGSYTEEALIAYFGEEAPRDNFMHFEDVFKALDLGEIQYAVLPIENSSTGAIREVYDLLVKYGFFIIGEHHLRINHNLLGVNGASIEDIQEIYSHTQGIEQCTHYLDEHPAWKKVPYYNTAISAKYVAGQQRKELAAIGSKRAASIYGLEILKENIHDNMTNTTRFVVLSRTMQQAEDANKVSLVLSTPHKAGALYEALSKFADEQVNMMKIESRPIKDKPWEYFFFIDIEGQAGASNVANALEKIQAESRYFKVLGCYKKRNGVD